MEFAVLEYKNCRQMKDFELVRQSRIALSIDFEQVPERLP